MLPSDVGRGVASGGGFGAGAGSVGGGGVGGGGSGGFVGTFDKAVPASKSGDLSKGIALMEP